MNPPDGPTLRRKLLAWYRRARRDMPWRSDPPNPYHVLVSEAMLQQTQVATVIDYFNRFVDRLPTIAALADADEQLVLRLWQGLGYYRRARHLHSAARRIVTQHAGRIPTTAAELLQLPGVGRYTAAAVASIAFKQPVAVLDGNVARVLARWFAIDRSIDDAPVKAELWSLAESLVPQHPRASPGDYNQAVMELGALVCTPRQPQCLACPVASLCRAHALGRADDLPVRHTRRKPVAVTHHVIALRRGRKLLFEQRPPDGLWSNMWQLPTAEAVPEVDLPAWLAARVGLTPPKLQRIATFTHQTTHRTIDFVLWSAPAPGGRGRPTVGTWRTPSDIDDLPLPNPQHKALSLLLNATP
jgi:A/G-specific adenine glycosylase